ncbi:hypothetical protein BGW80DRAFT_1448128 [Lactifluus volemus]|nr:hypothetical protein BGW80DRAFT_1448128 [Lactifluus volemus]
MHKLPFLTIKAKRDAAAGSTVLWIETTVSARPFRGTKTSLVGRSRAYKIGEHVPQPMLEIDIDPSYSMISTHNALTPLPERSVTFLKGDMREIGTIFVMKTRRGQKRPRCAGRPAIHRPNAK